MAVERNELQQHSLGWISVLRTDTQTCHSSPHLKVLESGFLSDWESQNEHLLYQNKQIRMSKSQMQNKHVDLISLTLSQLIK